MPHGTKVFIVLCLLLCAGGLAAQSSHENRIHSFLRARMETALPGSLLPVYFVMADRLGYEDWFPQVNRLSVSDRRMLVVAELRKHAAATQARLLALLHRLEERGLVSEISANWLGNFVQCKAAPLAIVEVSTLEDVEEARYNASWPLALVEDGCPAVAGAFGNPPGDGPVNTRADKVWALGFTGRGVVVMNADSGINIMHGDLANRLWINPGEIPNNKIDDDRNGYVDDVYGWNFFNKNDQIDDNGGHGTMTAGCLVADGSCTRINTGQAPGARVMTGKLGALPPQNGPANPAGEVAEWDALQYALLMGAHIATSSHSYKNGFVPQPNYRMHREVSDNTLAAGLIRTNSTSNNGAYRNDPNSLNRIPFNISSPGNVPAPYLDPAQTLVGRKSGVIGVGAHDVNSNNLAGYSPSGPFAWFLPDLLAVTPTYPKANWKSPDHDDYPWAGGKYQGAVKPDITGPTNTLTSTGPGTCGTRITTGTSTATPRAAGCMILWKEANMSLGPEDIAMIAHQSAISSGSVQGKENRWGAGRIDALAGLYLALCTHRINGEPAWRVSHAVGTSATIEVDTVAGSSTWIVLGFSRTARSTGGGVLGIGPPFGVLYSGTSGPKGEVRLTIPVPIGFQGNSVFTQCFTDDTRGVTGMLLSSNVIETRLISPPFEVDATTSGGGVGDLRIAVRNIPAGAGTGYCLFSEAATRPIGSGPMFGIWPTTLTARSLTTPAKPGNPYHWTWPVASPAFPAGPYGFPPNSFPVSRGMSLDVVVAAFAPDYTFLGATPVKRVPF